MIHFLYEISIRLIKIHMQNDEFRNLSPVIYTNDLDRDHVCFFFCVILFFSK